MAKEIPKRKGQALNGIGPSAAALVILVIFLPVGTAFLVDAALYFGDSEEPITIDSSNMNYDESVWLKSGDGEYAKCDNTSQMEVEYPNFLSDCMNKSPSSSNYKNGSFRSLMPGCTDSSVAPLPMSSCGDDGFIIGTNITHQIVGKNVVFTNLFFEFQAEDAYVCDDTLFGNSLVDYKIKFNSYSENGAGYILEESIEMSGTNSFNNGAESAYGGWNPNLDFCRPTVTIYHTPDLAELSQLTQLLTNWKDLNNSNKSVWFTLEMNNLRDENNRGFETIGRLDPFRGNSGFDVWYTYEFQNNQIDPINGVLRFGVFLFGAALWLTAIASTPFWDPIKKRAQGVRK